MLTEKLVCILLIVLFLLTLIPLFAIAPYNHSCADDYSYGLNGYRAWTETGSLLEVVKGAKDVMVEYYETWQGTFSAIFMMGLQPAIFGENLYFLVPVILIPLLSLSTFLFVRTVLKKYLGANNYEVFLVAIPVTALSIQFLPSAVEGFYWYNGAVFYTFFYSLQLIMFSLLLLCFKAKAVWARWIYGIVAVLLAAIIGGSNYTTSLLTCIWMFFTTVFLGFKKDKKAFLSGGMLAACGAALLISALAPGNAVRQSAFTDTPSPISAIIRSFITGCRYLVTWTTLPVILMVVFLVPIAIILVRRSHFQFRYPLIVSLLSFCIFSASFTPPIFAMGNEGPGRLLNIIYYSYLLFLTGNVFYIVGWIYRKWEQHMESSSRERAEETITKGCRKYSVFGLVLLAGAMVISCRFTPGWEQITSVSALKDLIDGRAAAYHQQVQDRMAILNDPSIKEAVVEPITIYPYVLYFTDLSTDKNDWPNTAVAAYFKKSTVELNLP